MDDHTSRLNPTGTNYPVSHVAAMPLHTLFLEQWIEEKLSYGLPVISVGISMFPLLDHCNYGQCFLCYRQTCSSVYLGDEILSLVIGLGLNTRIIGQRTRWDGAKPVIYVSRAHMRFHRPTLYSCSDSRHYMLYADYVRYANHYNLQAGRMDQGFSGNLRQDDGTHAAGQDNEEGPFCSSDLTDDKLADISANYTQKAEDLEEMVRDAMGFDEYTEAEMKKLKRLVADMRTPLYQSCKEKYSKVVCYSQASIYSHMVCCNSSLLARAKHGDEKYSKLFATLKLRSVVIWCAVIPAWGYLLVVYIDMV